MNQRQAANMSFDADDVDMLKSVMQSNLDTVSNDASSCSSASAV